MIVLGIETSCDETAAAVVRDGAQVLSNIVAAQHEVHTQFGGVVPELASRAHCEKILPVVEAALRASGISHDQVDAVAVGHRPGLIGSLLVGVAAAKALAWTLGKPLIGVDHVHAHLYAGLLSAAPGANSPNIFPALGLVVSGGHTSIYLLHSWTKLERLGATIDDALGEAFDKAATILGLPYPGGPNLDRLAQTAGADDRAADLPISRLAPDSLDFSFSGLKTAMLYEVKGVPAHPAHRRADSRYQPPPPLTETRRRDLAATFQRTAVRAITFKLERALLQLRERGVRPVTLLTGGGVTANSRLRRELEVFASGSSLRLFLPEMRYCVDNAAMIAGLADRLHAAGLSHELTLEPVPTTAC
ncbi:MAG: tRNA (adenosine(37)-N6)-threonylcarbamoyltransferase complex transferase subunit TsaD [Phycisphaerae bacterium]|nr:tRNA (adenosine(37)-N6)-threonylcarbamoyltransferase complex transferase subunit TsaD [Phycisphaerae bacterium]